MTAIIFRAIVTPMLIASLWLDISYCCHKRPEEAKSKPYIAQEFTFSEEGPLETSSSCTSTLGSPGRCVDVHLCRSVLKDIVAENLYPKICDFSHAAQTVHVCCPVEYNEQCGVAFPEQQGFKSALRITEKKNANRGNSFKFALRRPPEDEALQVLATLHEVLASGNRITRPEALAYARRSSRGNKTQALWVRKDQDVGQKAQAYSALSSSSHSSEALEFNPIANGVEAARGEFPWLALVGKKRSRGDMYWFCGGTLIGHEWVVTAAHCIAGDVQWVRLGAHNLKSDPSDDAKDFRISEIISHPDYDESKLYYDIALLRLSKIVEYERYIQPLCLPRPGFNTQRELSTNDQLISAGWGHKSFGGRPSTVLLKTQDLRFVPTAECQNIYISHNFKFRLQHSKAALLCAMDKRFQSDPCQGDSGGPLMLYDPEVNSYQLVGVVAAGIGCGGDIFPGMYTDVARFHAWIRSHISR